MHINWRFEKRQQLTPRWPCHPALPCSQHAFILVSILPAPIKNGSKFLTKCNYCHRTNAHPHPLFTPFALAGTLRVDPAWVLHDPMESITLCIAHRNGIKQREQISDIFYLFYVYDFIYEYFPRKTCVFCFCLLMLLILLIVRIVY